ncbi:MAG: isoprenylcysteine carboxylmethyltransferase family protein [Gammaproteobacteria bacterium]|nr:isoprenylcysteine carboxylmethyltransferase family protein [Gammaproteobacteria bacterium]
MKTLLRHPLWSYGLVLLQFSSIAMILTSGAWWTNHWLSWSAQAIGLLLGVWAVQTMHLGRFNIIPDPKEDSQLVEVGPYRWIRHPMYASILWLLFPMLIADGDLWRWMWFLVLLLTLLLKLHYEESLLSQRFQDYKAYQQRSKKLLPWVY